MTLNMKFIIFNLTTVYKFKTCGEHRLKLSYRQECVWYVSLCVVLRTEFRDDGTSTRPVFSLLSQTPSNQT